MFFDSWGEVFRTIVVGIMTYIVLVVMLRVSGKRTLSKMSAFDLIVTVALGSTLATVLLSQDVALLEGITAFAVLIGMQYVVAWLSVRSQTVRQLVKSEPALLFHNGHYLTHAMTNERVTHEEVRAAVRAQGYATMEAVSAVVLETDGSFTVISPSGENATALQGVKHYPPS